MEVKSVLDQTDCVCSPCFLAVRVMVSLKVLQLELSPPQTPHLSSCFEEPTTPSQPTFCSWGHGKLSTSAFLYVKHMQLSCSLSHLTLSTHAHTVRVLVWATCAVQDHSLHEDNISCLLGLAMQVAAFVSWKTNRDAQKWHNSSDDCIRMARSRSILMISSLQPTCDLFLFFHFLNKRSMSQHDALSHCVYLCESYYNYMSLQRQNLAVHPSENEHSYFITFITDGHNPGTLSHSALTLISRWQTCYCGITICV